MSVRLIDIHFVVDLLQTRRVGDGVKDYRFRRKGLRNLNFIQLLKTVRCRIRGDFDSDDTMGGAEVLDLKRSTAMATEETRRKG